MKSFVSFKDFFVEAQGYWASKSGRQNSATGWFSKTGQWIPVDSYHDHPKYIHMLEPSLEPDPNNKNIPKEKDYDPFDYPDQERKKEICIANGAIRVAQADLGDGPDISIQANSLFALKGAISKLSRMFPQALVDYPVYADVMAPDGKITASFEMDEDGKLRKLMY